jgi:hypothetical protein
MSKTRISLAMAATLILCSTGLYAQTASGAQTAKPSPYEGVSTPPSADAITTSEDSPVAAPVAPVVVPPRPSVPAVASNPDAGIIETPLPGNTADYTPHAAELRTRAADQRYDVSNDNRDDGIVTYVPGPANALPEGTVFRARMLQDIDAATVTPGTPFRASLTRDILRNGKVVVPVGSELRGRVVYATAGRRISGGSVIHLRPDEFVLPDGTRYHLHAQVIDTDGSDTKAKGEGDISANQHGKRSLTEVGLGAGSGAIIGAAVGGGVGAVVGSAVGAGVTTAHWLLTNWSANLPASSVVVFSLTDPMFLNAAADLKNDVEPHS